MKDLSQIITKMNKEWNIVSITDIVLNHTANESQWLLKHPDSTYNMSSSPHLRPAYLIDRALYHFSIEISEKKWKNRGIPSAVTTGEHLQAIRNVLFDQVLTKPRVEELYQVDVEKMLQEFKSGLDKASTTPSSTVVESAKIQIIQDPQFKRKNSTVSIQNAIQAFNINW